MTCTDEDRELMRKKDKLNIALSWCGIFTGIITIIAVFAGIFVSIYVRPVEARINGHIDKFEPVTTVLVLKVNALEIQFSEIIKKLDRIEVFMSKEQHGR
jgi:hypothetical protein